MELDRQATGCSYIDYKLFICGREHILCRHCHTAMGHMRRRVPLLFSFFYIAYKFLCVIWRSSTTIFVSIIISCLGIRTITGGVCSTFAPGNADYNNSHVHGGDGERKKTDDTGLRGSYWKMNLIQYLICAGQRQPSIHQIRAATRHNHHHPPLSLLNLSHWTEQHYYEATSQHDKNTFRGDCFVWSGVSPRWKFVASLRGLHFLRVMMAAQPVRPEDDNSKFISWKRL